MWLIETAIYVAVCWTCLPYLAYASQGLCLPNKAFQSSGHSLKVASLFAANIKLWRNAPATQHSSLTITYVMQVTATLHSSLSISFVMQGECLVYNINKLTDRVIFHEKLVRVAKSFYVNKQDVS